MMMSATYLKDLPSFNKDNFQNFQPSNSLSLKRRNSDLVVEDNSVFHCAKDRRNSDAQLIINPPYNIVVKYLEKQVEEKIVTNSNSNKQKRSINQVFSNKSIVVETSGTIDALTSHKYLKKRKHDESQLMDEMQS